MAVKRVWGCHKRVSRSRSLCGQSLETDPAQRLPNEIGKTPIQVTGRFEPQTQSAGEARRFVRASLVDWEGAAVIDVVVLLTSEVVSNVILHAGPHGPGSEVVVALRRTGNRIRIEVADGHPGFPAIGDGALDQISGRGLLILDALADVWGVTPEGDGKVVWFEVEV
jgi:anti-sigma regulatory factor (Ser/Thr protein kinase)